MKKTLQIAKNELYGLFYSPIAWVMLAIFVAMTSLDFVNVLGEFAFWNGRGGPNLQYIRYLTGGFICGQGFGLLPRIIHSLYIFFPLITMGLLSKEVSGGTIKLLYSSPVKIREIVLGKFLTMVVFTLVLMLLAVIHITVFCFCVGHPDIWHIVVSEFGLFLVLCTYAAIGIFVSSLTSYQIVAAIVTVALFNLFDRLQGWWQKIPVLGDIGFYMNLSGKAVNLLNALVNLRDVSYFLIIIGSFLFFTALRIKSGTESIKWYRTASRYALVVVVAVTLALITKNPWVNVYYDATSNKRFTITKPTQAMLAKLHGEPLEVTAYANMFDDRGYGAFIPQNRNQMIADVWEKYIRFKPDINFTFKYYYALDSNSWRIKKFPGKTLLQIAQKQSKDEALSMRGYMSPEEVSKEVDIEREDLRCFFVLKYHGKSAILRIFWDQDVWPSEDETAAAINRLLATPPKIGFLTGDIERGPYSQRSNDYFDLVAKNENRYTLTNQGYDYDTVSLDGRPSVPDDLAALVIADPRVPISPVNLEKIYKYIDGGGNLLVMTEPDRKEIVKPILDKLGLSLRPGMMIQPDPQFVSSDVLPYLSDTAKYLAPRFTNYLKDQAIFQAKDNFAVCMPGASALDYTTDKGFSISSLLNTDPGKSWNRVAPIDPDSLNLMVPRTSTDQNGTFPMALRLNRMINGKEQRIIVTGDADFLTKKALNRETNYFFDFWMFSYFGYGAFPANTVRYESQDNTLFLKTQDIPLLRIVLAWIIPGIIAAIGAVILIRRLRK